MSQSTQKSQSPPIKAVQDLNLHGNPQCVLRLIQRAKGHLRGVNSVLVQAFLLRRKAGQPCAGTSPQHHMVLHKVKVRHELCHHVKDALALEVDGGFECGASAGQGSLHGLWGSAELPRLANGRQHVAGYPVGEGIGFGLVGAKGQFIHGGFGDELELLATSSKGGEFSHPLPAGRNGRQSFAAPVDVKRTAHINGSEPCFVVFGKGTNAVCLERKNLGHDELRGGFDTSVLTFCTMQNAGWSKQPTELLAAFRQCLGHIGHTRQTMTEFTQYFRVTTEKGQKESQCFRVGVTAVGKVFSTHRYGHANHALNEKSSMVVA